VYAPELARAIQSEVTNGWIIGQAAGDLRITRLWQEHVDVQEVVLIRKFKRLPVGEQREGRSGLYLPILSVTGVRFP